MIKQLKKILVLTLLVIVLFESIVSTNVSLAISSEEAPISPEFINSMNNLAGGIVSILFWRYRATLVLVCFVIDALLNIVAGAQGTLPIQGYKEGAMITPFDIFFNRYVMLDINVFDLDTPDDNSTILVFRQSTAMWYYTMRTLATAILLVVLIYIGIRMLLSSVAEDRAKYKKMLFDWICSLILLFLLQYMAIFIIYLNNAIVNALREFVVNRAGSNGLQDIGTAMYDMGIKGLFGVGMQSITAMFAFAGLVLMTAAFFIAYLNRMFKVAFLIMISPLITITYSIDKIGDGKAQALGNWLKQYISTVIIQPFHCIIYISFVQTAFNLVVQTDTSATGSPLTDIFHDDFNKIVNCFLALICLLFVFQAEGVVRNIFGIKEDKDTSALAGVVIGMAALSKAKQASQFARKGVNTLSSTHKRLNQALTKDNSRLENYLKNHSNNFLAKGAKGFTDKALSVNKAISDASGKINQFSERIRSFKSLPGLKLSEYAKKHSGTFRGALANRAISGFKRVNNWNKSLSVAATLGAMTSLASGGNIFEAAKTYDALDGAAKEFNTTSKDNIADTNATLNSQMDDTEFENKVSELGRMDDKIKAAKEEMSKEGSNSSYQKVLAVAMADRARTELELQKAIMDNLVAQRSRGDNSEELAEEIGKAAAERQRLQDLVDKGDQQGEFTEEEQALYDLMNEREKMKDELDNFFTFEASSLRAKARNQSVSTSAIQEKKNRIIALLTKLEVDRGNGPVDLNADNEYNQSTIGSLMEHITADMQKNALTATGYNGDERMGQIAAAMRTDETVGKNAEKFAELRTLLGDLDNLYKQKEMSANVQKYTSVGGNSAALQSTVENRTGSTAARKNIPTFSNLEDL